MDFLFVLFFLFIAFNMFRNFVKAAGGQSSKSGGDISRADPLSDIKSHLERAAAQGSNNWNGEGYEGDYENGDWSFGSPKTSSSSRKPRRKYSYKNKGQKQAVNFDFSGRNGANKDKNRQRRDDWGRRQQKEVLSGTNVVIALIFGVVVLYMLSQF